jgi:hypothetical protein
VLPFLFEPEDYGNMLTYTELYGVKFEDIVAVNYSYLFEEYIHNRIPLNK